MALKPLHPLWHPQVLQNEQDMSTKRNAFQFLANHAEERAVIYLLAQIDNVALWGDILQMAVLDLIRKVHLCCIPALFCGGRFHRAVCRTRFYIAEIVAMWLRVFASLPRPCMVLPGR